MPLNVFENDNFAQYVGIELIDSGKKWARAKLEIEEKHLNGAGLLHGGAIYTLAVWTFAVAANTGEDLSVGIQANISYLSGMKEGTIYAEAKVLSDNPKISSYGVTITDEKQKVIATFQGMAYTKRSKS